jgi:Tfp pilus assembly protein PilE
MIDLRLFSLLLLLALWGPKAVQSADFGFGLIIAGIIASVASSAYSAYSQSQTAKAQADQAEKTAQHNAEVAKNEAEQERLNRSAQEREERRDMLRRRAAIEAAYAKSGVLLEGTPAQYLTEQATTDELNVQRGNQQSTQVRRALLQRSSLYLTEGSNMAGAFRTQARGALVGGALDTVGTAGRSVGFLESQGYTNWLKG